MGLAEAAHDEYGPTTGPSVITPLACALQGVDIDIELVAGSRLAARYGVGTGTEHATCSFGLDPGWQTLADEGGMRAVATDASGEVRAVERPAHPYFIATLYQPQLRSRPGSPHPVFSGLIEATAR